VKTNAGPIEYKYYQRSRLSMRRRMLLMKKKEKCGESLSLDLEVPR
jgi:hypothetical protein